MSDRGSEPAWKWWLVLFVGYCMGITVSTVQDCRHETCHNPAHIIAEVERTDPHNVEN